MFEDIPFNINPCADWHNPDHYRLLLESDRAGWAGEWLRRNPAFIADMQRAPCRAHSDVSGAYGHVPAITCTEPQSMRRWGLRCCHMDGDRPMFFWLPQYNPQVLAVEAFADETDGFDLRRCSLLKAVLHGPEQETHLLFKDDARSLQVVIRGSVALEKPLVFNCNLHGWNEFGTKPLSLRRLCQLYRQDRLVKSLYPREQRARRWVEMIRTWDGIQTGAGQREIAATLFGGRAARDGWETGYRTRMQRLVRSGKRMVGARRAVGDYYRSECFPR